MSWAVVGDRVTRGSGGGGSVTALNGGWCGVLISRWSVVSVVALAQFFANILNLIGVRRGVTHRSRRADDRRLG